MLQDRPAMTRSEMAILDGVKLDKEARIVFDWLLNVRARSTSSEDQVFIFRDLSRLNKLIRRDKRGEVKAIGMSDLLKVHRTQIRALADSCLITYRKGRWPGKWFTVNLDGGAGRP